MEPKRARGLVCLASPRLALAWFWAWLRTVQYVQGFALLHERKCRVLVRR